jgi:hypothetical protein
MIPIMAPPSRSSSAAPEVPEQLQPLVKQLVELSEVDRQLVIRAANSQAEPRKLRTMSWETLDRARGIVSLGGDAVEDCKALYDG